MVWGVASAGSSKAPQVFLRCELQCRPSSTLQAYGALGVCELASATEISRQATQVTQGLSVSKMLLT